MKSKANIFLSFVFIFIPLFIIASETPSYYYQKQEEYIRQIIDNETSIKNCKNIIDIVNYTDDVYKNLWDRLKKKEKIVIFFDPAHGRLENGKWEGETTGKISSNGIPEEIYSLQYARKLYKLLKKNKYLKITSTDDYLQAIESKRDDYRRISFSETIKHAVSEKAFIIISEHMNNISGIRKADGIVNIPGIHITYENGNRYLSYISGAHKGFLTLYNKFDSTGLSKKIADRTKELLIAKGVNINSWEFGAVPDDRFSYFVNFPVSIIFENGFISNPEEEKLLSDPDYQDIIVKSQYKAILDSMDVFGVDISGFRLKKTKTYDPSVLMKLSRIALYYLQNDDPEKAIYVINILENEYLASHPELTEYFTEIKENIIKAEDHYKKSNEFLRKKKYTNAESHMKKALRNIDGFVYGSIKYKYTEKAAKLFGITDEVSGKEKVTIPLIPSRAKRNTPVIFAVETDQSMKQALINALDPDPKTLSSLVQKFENPYLYKKIRISRYSKEKKKQVYYYIYKKEKIEFRDGIYIIELDKDMRIILSKRMNHVLLDPEKYQNQQYLNNSYFAQQSKQKSL